MRRRRAYSRISAGALLVAAFPRVAVGIDFSAAPDLPVVTLSATGEFVEEFFEAEAETLFAAMTGAPSDARKIVINDLILALKNAGVWTKIDKLYVLAAHDAQAASLNWKSPGANALTANNSPTFTTDRGYTGNGSNTGLTGGFNENQIGAYSQNSSHLALWSRTNSQEDKTDMGDTSFAHLYIRLRMLGSPNQTRLRMTTDVGNLTTTITNSTGMFIGNRSGANDVQLYRNGSSIASSGAIASSAIPTGDAIHFMHAPSTGSASAREFAMFGLGVSLGATEASDYYSALLAYMQAVGAA
jgi:hypothetical protein